MTSPRTLPPAEAMARRPIRVPPVRRAVAVTLTVAGVLAALLVAFHARHLLLLTLLGVIFGLTLAAGADRLERWRIPRGVGVLLLLAALAGVGWLLVRAVGPTFSRQNEVLAEQLPRAVDQVERWLGARLGRLPAALGERTPLRGRVGGELARALPNLLSFLSSALGAVLALVLMLAVAVYTALDPGLYRRGVVLLLPPEHRPRADALLGEIADVWRRWVAAQLVAMILIALVTWGALAMLGVRAALALGVLAGALEIVPFFGPIVAALPAVGVALLESPRLALSVTLAYVVIQQLEGNVITPLVMRRGVDVPPLVTVLGAAALGLFAGVIGLLVAAPLLAAALTLVRFFGRPEFLNEKTEGDGG